MQLRHWSQFMESKKLFVAYNRLYICDIFTFLNTVVRLLVYSECLATTAGHEYNGTVNTTRSGRSCQPWSSNTPHVVPSSYTDDRFPDGSRSAAENYCRNPDPSWDSGVWCYTMDADVEYESCNIPLCNPRKSFVLSITLPTIGFKHRLIQRTDKARIPRHRH